MRNAIVYSLLIMHLSLFAQPNITSERFSNYYFLKNVLIEGETNINNFNFSFNNSKINIIPVKEKSINSSSDKDIVEFFIPVRAFRGSNYLMESDFQELLNAQDYPMVKVGIERNKLNDIISESGNLELSFYLTIAGVTKLINGNYLINLCGENEIILQGSTQVKLTDFSINPPKKMLGVLQVKDLISIKFDIIISNSNS